MVGEVRSLPVSVGTVRLSIWVSSWSTLKYLTTLQMRATSKHSSLVRISEKMFYKICLRLETILMVVVLDKEIFCEICQVVNYFYFIFCKFRFNKGLPLKRFGPLRLVQLHSGNLPPCQLAISCNCHFDSPHTVAFWLGKRAPQHSA